ncbi:MAG TPA: Sua5/YciO/YrdC/YwlC family protein, partial [Tepidisphaeraceae bacterium]
MATTVVRILDSQNVSADLERASAALERGELVVLPTETVYGVAGRIDLPQTRLRLEALRGGNTAQPWTLHLAKPEQAWEILPPSHAQGMAARLIKKLWPGPVGLIFDVPPERRAVVAAKYGVEEAVLFDNGTITLRCPLQPVFEDVVSKVNAPIVVTRLGEVTNQIPADFASQASDVDLVLDAGPTRYSKPSTLLRVKDDGYEIVRAGIFDDRILQRQLRTTILFVCSGNTCRSPMADALARKIISKSLGVSESQLEQQGYEVVSAGVYAMPGTRATPQAVEAVRSMDADLSRHRSQPLTRELVNQADTIYGMGESHLNAIRSVTPSAASKLHLLDSSGDIEDPIGSDV